MAASIAGCLPVCDFAKLQRNPFRRENEVDTATFDGTLRHVWLDSGIELLGDRDAPDICDAAKRRCAITVIARNNDRDQLSFSIFGQ